MKNNKTEQLVIERFSPTIDGGLSSAQVEQRYAQGAINSTKQKYSKSYLNIFVNNVCTVFNLLGLICFVSLIATGASLSQFFFSFFYVANIAIGVIQEIRAKKCIDKLSLVANKGVKVIRNGEEIEIPTDKIVLDDIIKLGIGSQIPTDCIILQGDIEVNEALLTGESVAVKKRVGDQILAGSFITSGTCLVKADKVGKDNYVETLSAKAKQYKKPQSEIMNSLKLIIRIIGFVIIPLATAFMIKSLIIYSSSGITSSKIAEAVLGAATVVIGMIPAGMFLLTSVALAVGIIKLARHNTLVQDLYSLEMLARVDTICFDKTGTITDGKMTVKELVPLCEHNTDVNLVVSSMINVLKDNNQTAIALYEYFGQNQEFTAKTSLPFNSTRKLSAVTFDKIGTYAFGAPEFVLSKDEFNKIEQKVNEYTSKGLRVLLLAHSNNQINEDQTPKDFTPISLIIIADNVREDAISTIQWFKDNGVSVKVISGDNPITVSEVSKRVGIENAEKYISLEGLSDEEVALAANKYTVFGRVSPEQKAILIKALKADGHVTAMTGDGVNDILALKESDCAISVAAGSDAARNVSHLVLTDNNFNSLPKVVYEGRRVINNVQSSASLFLMKTFFTMFMGIITLCLPYMHTYPFKASQIIILEVLVIGLPAFILSLQPNDARVEGKFVSSIIKKSLPGSLLMLISVLIIEVFKKCLGLFGDEVYTTMQVFTILCAGVINLMYVCRPFNLLRAVLFSSSAILVLLVICISMFVGLDFFGFSLMMPLSEYWHHVLIVASVILLDIPLSILLQWACSKINFDFKLKNNKN